MSNAMDGLSLVRSNGDHHHHEELNKRVVPIEDLGENSNGSSSSNGGTSKEELDTDIPRLTTSSTKQRESLSPSHLHHNQSGHNQNPTSLLHNHRTNSRANYCQFETPADETRGTFPDDFDEEIFISSGQLVESSNEVGQFDEEMESTHDDSHNHLNHQLNLDTADHSESSDMEDNVYPMTNPLTTSTTTCSSSSSTNSNINYKKNSGSSTNSSFSNPVIDSNASLTPTSSIVTNGSTDFVEEPMHEDLNSNDNADDPCIQDLQETIIKPGSQGSSYCQDVDEDYANSLEDVEPCASSSSPMRKRKGYSDDTLPAKKSVKENCIEIEENLYSPINLDSPELLRLEEDDIEIKDKSKSPRAIIPTKENPPPHLTEWLDTFTDWSNAERLMAINHLIQSCEPTQVRHMMKVIEPQFQRDFISLLPKELALYVLSFLEPKDLLRAAQTCRYWRILCDDNLLWREKCREAGVGYFSAMSQRVHAKRNRGNQPSCPSNCSVGSNGNNCSNGGCNESSSPTNSICNMSRWKVAYLRQHNVEMNWRFQPIRPTKVLKGHDDHVITCLQFSANRIVSGSDDNTLKVWSANTGKCLRTLIGHTGGVWSSQMSGATIVSGSTDRTLRVWNADTGACMHTLYGHTSTVRCMHLFGRKVVSGSRDATLRVWDVDSGECLHVLVGHMAAVRCVQYNGTIVVSGAYDYMVRVWDVEREECLHQLSGHTNRVYSLQFDGIHVVSGSLDTSIRVWDVKTGACKHTLMGHQSLTSGMELRDNLLVSGNADSTVKIWDINTGQCLLTLSGPNKHLSAVTCLQLINKFVITSSDDGTVKLWDIRTGDFVRNLVTLTSGGSGGVVWRIRASETKLVCAVGSRNGTEETKLLVLDFDVEPSNGLMQVKLP